ncbi:hypothetical protein RYX36_009824 [Vicia faba]
MMLKLSHERGVQRANSTSWTWNVVGRTMEIHAMEMISYLLKWNPKCNALGETGDTI